MGREQTRCISRIRKFSLILLIAIGFQNGARADEPATIQGEVRDAATGKVLYMADLVVPGSTVGTFTMEDGSFRLLLPPGEYSLRVQYLGYRSVLKEGIHLKAGEVLQLNFALELGEAFKGKGVTVWMNPDEQTVCDTRAMRTTNQEDLQNFALDTMVEALSLETGIMVINGELHVRGGRGSEVSYTSDDVPIDNPLGGSIAVSNVAISSIQTVVGGMDAEYGNAQSAVINVTTREGGERFHGTLRYWTDDYGRQDKTYANFDRLATGIGGPLFRDELRWFLAGEVAGQDGEFLAADGRREWKVFDDLFKFSERASSQLQLTGKLTWRATSDLKFSAEGNFNLSRDDPYVHNWNQQGYVNRLHVFERLELSGESDEQGEHFFHVARGTLPVYHGPWYEEFYLPNRERQRQGLPTAFEKVLLKMKPAGADQPAYVVVDAFRARSARSGTEFLVLTEELFGGYLNTLSRWSYERTDSSQTYYNSAEHTPVSDSRNSALKLLAIHNISDEVFYKIALSRLDFSRHSAVGGKEPADYDTAGHPATLINGALQRSLAPEVYYTDPANPFLATAYDFPNYFDQRARSWILKFDLTSRRWPGHRIKTGFLAQYNDMRNVQMTSPGLTRPLMDDLTGRTLGLAQGRSANIFHNFAPRTAFYCQDRWEYRGMVVNAGLRYDLFSPGNGVEVLLRAEGVDPSIERFKQVLSPRLGLAFPITDRDVFHFHYGRSFQAPGNNRLFQTQDPNSGEALLGNPDLDPEITVSYQAGVRHQFSTHITGDFAIFYKDIYDLVTSTTAVDSVSGNTFSRYINRAYASARGLEVTLDRRFADGYGGQIAYTLGFADGVASDAEFGAQGASGLTHLPTGELPLRWDQRHVLSFRLRLMDAGSWGGSFIYAMGSGLPWTPALRNQRRADPRLENSRRHPATHSLSMQAEKYFDLWGRALTLFFDGRNLLDQDQVVAHDPGIYPGMPYAESAYTTYLTETGRYGGAYLTDLDGDGQDEYHPVDDPRVFASRRNFRVGFGLEF
jgi:outer membrane receptor protein involved in Fe transport